MGKPEDETDDWEQRRAQIIGLGEFSSRKSYYPELQQQLKELKKTRAGLADAFFQLQSVLDAASEISIIATDRNGVITLFNRGAEKMLGYKAEEVVGIQTPLVLHSANEVGERAQELNRRLHQRVEGFNALVQHAVIDGSETSEWSYIRKDTYPIAVSLSITAIHDADGSLNGFLFIATDISSRKSYENALNKRIVALTEPMETTDITFLDLFDLDDIQNLQDAFAEATRVASIITTPDGTPITRPSRFCRLCNDIIRKTEKGLYNCIKSDAVLGRQNPDGPVVQPCFSGGLWDGGASIIVGGNHVANWLIGQVKVDRIDEGKLVEYADEIGADKQAFLDALREVPEMSLEQFQHVSKFLFMLASELSLKAFQNIQQARFIGQRKQAAEELAERVMLAELSADIGQTLTKTGDIGNLLCDCTYDLVRHLDLAVAAIWVFNTGGNELELQACFGSTEEGGKIDRIDMPHGRVKIAQIARARKPHISLRMEKDPYIEDKKWAENAGLVAFAGYPLTIDNYLVGVMAVFSRRPFSPPTFKALHSIANVLAVGIERKQAGEQLNRLNTMLEQRVRERTSELEQANKDLKSMQSQLLQQEKMASVGQLAAGVAHEINNPMGFIISNLTTLAKYLSRIVEFQQAQDGLLNQLMILQEQQPGAQQMELEHLRKQLKIDMALRDAGPLITESLEGGDRIKRIVQNLKSFARLDEDAYKLSDLNAGLESTLSIVWNELKYKATVVKNYGDIPAIMCNAGQLNQVFMNLLVNAGHAIDNKGVITINTWQEHENIMISVADTGCGIAPDKINRIFEPFFTTKEVGKGTGLGLSIAYDIVKKHNGDIQVESRLGEGTTFTVILPVRIE